MHAIIGYLTAMNIAIKRALAEVADKNGMDIMALRILHVIPSIEEATPRRIASSLDVQRSSISKYIKSLSNQGYLLYSYSHVDRRIINLKLTRSGMYLVDQIDRVCRSQVVSETSKQPAEMRKAISEIL